MINLIDLANIAKDVYHDEAFDCQSKEDKWREHLHNNGYSRKGNPYTGTIGFFGAVYEKNGHFILCYRGSDDKKDWFFNNTAMTAKLFGTPQSSGAYRALVRCCEDHGPPSVIVGHSLGGALAQLMGIRVDYPFVSFNGPGMHIERGANTLLRFGGNLITRALGNNVYQVPECPARVAQGLDKHLHINIKGDVVSIEGPKILRRLRAGSTVKFDQEPTSVPESLPKSLVKKSIAIRKSKHDMTSIIDALNANKPFGSQAFILYEKNR